MLNLIETRQTFHALPDAIAYAVGDTASSAFLTRYAHPVDVQERMTLVSFCWTHRRATYVVRQGAEFAVIIDGDAFAPVEPAWTAFVDAAWRIRTTGVMV